MSRYGSPSFAVLLADGYDLLAAKVQNVSHKVEAAQEASHGLGDRFQAQSPTGMHVATLTQDGAFFDDATAGMHEALNSAQATSRILTFAYLGNVIGNAFVGLEGVYAMAYEVLAKNGLLTKANVTYAVSGQLDRGIILQAHEAKTADWNTEAADSVDYAGESSQQVIPITSNSQANPTVVTTPVPHGLTSGDVIIISGVSGSSPTINGERTATVISPTTFSVPVDTSAGSGGTGGSFVRANSANGGVGYQQVSALSGFTGFVGKIRDSADDVTYADLITFANVTSAPNAQRIAVSGTVDRYLAYDGNVTGSGSITPFVGFSRS
jgi:hypothetical protein